MREGGSSHGHAESASTAGALDAILWPPSRWSTFIPEPRGGSDELDNLAFACLGCNGHKHAKTEASDPVTGKPAPLFHPRRHRWKDHFAWSQDYTLIIGETATGRATVSALQLNREAHINLRSLLYAAGAHPPPESEDD